MKFEEVYGRTHRGGLSQAEAAEVLGVSERTFRRWRDRYEAEGADGLYDRRLGRLSARRAPVDEVAQIVLDGGFEVARILRFIPARSSRAGRSSLPRKATASKAVLSSRVRQLTGHQTPA